MSCCWCHTALSHEDSEPHDLGLQISLAMKAALCMAEQGLSQWEKTLHSSHLPPLAETFLGNKYKTGHEVKLRTYRTGIGPSSLAEFICTKILPSYIFTTNYILTWYDTYTSPLVPMSFRTLQCRWFVVLLRNSNKVCLVNVCATVSTFWPWWRHQMKTFSALRAIVRGIHRSPVNSPHKGQWRGDLMFSFICVWINDWVNNREAGDLRRYRAHYDVTLMQAEVKIKLGQRPEPGLLFTKR